MIVDATEHWNRYALGPVWEELMTWVAANAATSPLGVYTVAGCTVKVEEARTEPAADRRYESHRIMADVQMVLEGEEWMECANAAALEPLGAFDTGRDVGFHANPAQPIGKALLLPGVFAVVFPWDAHKPLVAVQGSRTNKKLIAKIPLDRLNAGV